MNLIEFNTFKTVAVLFILIVLLHHCHHVFKYIVILNEKLNETKIIKTSTRNVVNALATAKRKKRFLTFESGGVAKLVFGTSFPVAMTGKGRSLNYFYNFQIQYSPPIKPLYWWSFLNSTIFMSRTARTGIDKRSVDDLMYYDHSRTLIYEFMEAIIKRSGNIGNECILKMICELSCAPFIEDPIPNIKSKKDKVENYIDDDHGRQIYHELINAIFRPLHSDIDERYLNAQLIGRNGVSCSQTFGKCPLVEKLFKSFTRFV